ncbi:MAG: hypothetical protein SGI71_08430 [Verrucomicrobiota bacterium]|nr:hypothetical protein [Verrucomicrobiota bacterium]
MKPFSRITNSLINRGEALTNKVFLRFTQRKRQREKKKALTFLDQFARQSSSSFQGNILIDAVWDNANHWLRYAFLRKALGLASGKEMGMVGNDNKESCLDALSLLGIKNVFEYKSLAGDQLTHLKEAQRLLAACQDSADILKWELPGGLPGDFIYDGILKKQRLATVELHDPALPGIVAEALAGIAAAENLYNNNKFDLVVLSHLSHFIHSPLAWGAISRKIPVVQLYGNYNSIRGCKLKMPADMYSNTDRPLKSDLNTLEETKKESMIAMCGNYLENRFTGKTADLAAYYAYQKRDNRVTRDDVCKRFGWDPQKKIIAVYASNWFDFPHLCGMKSFKDFLDWIQVTLKAAHENTEVNWLFKGHPCDEWYGGITLKDLISAGENESHVQQVDTTWNGADLIELIDGLVTFHGTAAVEFAAMGKPTMVADVGWYHDLGFVVWPKSREEYVKLLGSRWWELLNLESTKSGARLFGGWYFCKPSIQKKFLIQDDSLQNRLYANFQTLVESNRDIVNGEVETLGEWVKSDERFFHTFKMKRADNYTY